jgi:hypothetical protein
MVKRMRWGVYRKLFGRTGVGKLYQFVGISRHHTTGDEVIVYIPLRVQSNWAGTVRFCHLERPEFEAKFEYVGEGLPDDPQAIILSTEPS